MHRLQGLREERVEHHQQLQRDAKELREDQRDQKRDREAWRRARHQPARDNDFGRHDLRLKPIFIPVNITLATLVVWGSLRQLRTSVGSVTAMTS